jgi:segregation and condensation protein A
MIGRAIDWTAIEAFLPPMADPALRKSALASSFVAALELAKRGIADLRQEATFAPLMVRKRVR